MTIASSPGARRARWSRIAPQHRPISPSTCEVSTISLIGSFRRGESHAVHRGMTRSGRSPALLLLLLLATALAAVVGATVGRPATARGATDPNAPGSGFTVTAGDVSFMLKQIKIAERHASTLTPAKPCETQVNTPGDGIPDNEQIPDRLTSYGLRTVDGSCNNLFTSPDAN